MRKTNPSATSSILNTLFNSRAIAQAVSRRFPTAAARVQAQVRSCGICGGQSDTGAGFFPRTSVSPASSHSTDCSTPGAGAIGQLVTDVSSGLSLTPPQETKKIKREIPYLETEPGRPREKYRHHQ
jgi:hypothetical protein